MEFIAAGRKLVAQAFLFDKDGTLLSFDHWFFVMGERAARLAREFGLGENDHLALAQFMGADPKRRGNWGLITLPRPEAELRTAEFLASLLGEDVEVISSKVKEIFARVDQSFPFHRYIKPTPGAEKLVRAIKRVGGKVGVVTHDLARAARAHFAALGWDGLLDEVIGLDNCPARKPAPDGIQMACARLGITPQEAVMVGDTPSDLQAGRAAGCLATIGVLTGLGTAEELYPHADFVVPDLRALWIPPSTETY